MAKLNKKNEANFTLKGERQRVKAKKLCWMLSCCCCSLNCTQLYIQRTGCEMDIDGDGGTFTEA